MACCRGTAFGRPSRPRSTRWATSKLGWTRNSRIPIPIKSVQPTTTPRTSSSAGRLCRTGLTDWMPGPINRLKKTKPCYVPACRLLCRCRQPQLRVKKRLEGRGGGCGFKRQRECVWGGATEATDDHRCTARPAPVAGADRLPACPRQDAGYLRSATQPSRACVCQACWEVPRPDQSRDQG